LSTFCPLLIFIVQLADYQKDKQRIKSI